MSRPRYLFAVPPRQEQPAQATEAAPPAAKPVEQKPVSATVHRMPNRRERRAAKRERKAGAKS